MTTVVTAATDADTEQLCAIYFELFTHQHRGRPDLFREPRPGDPEEVERLAAFISEQRRLENATILVARDGDSVLGFVHVDLRRIAEAATVPFRRARCDAWIRHIAVSKTAHRRGVGRSLNDAAKDWAQERGAADVGLQVWDFNAGASAFFESVGYVPRSHQLYIE